MREGVRERKGKKPECYLCEIHIRPTYSLVVLSVSL